MQTKMRIQKCIQKIETGVNINNNYINNCETTPKSCIHVTKYEKILEFLNRLLFCNNMKIEIRLLLYFVFFFLFTQLFLLPYFCPYAL